MMNGSVLVLVVVLLLAGCGGAASGGAPVVIEFWALGREGEVVREMIPAFERAHPGLRVEVQQIPFSAAHEKLLTAYVGNATPDVFQLYNTWVPEFAALDALVNLRPYVEHSAVVDSAVYFSGIWKPNVVDGAVYGVPWYVDTRLLFYRTDLLAEAGFEAPPKTWAEWTALMQRLEAQGHYALLQPVNEWQLPVILALQRGAELLKDGGRHGAFSGPHFRRAFAFYVNIFREGWAPVVRNTQLATLYQDFAHGRYAMYVTGPWSIGAFRQRLPDRLQGRWMTAPMPAPPGEAPPGASLAGGASLAIFADAEHKAAAWELIEYLSRPAQQLRLYRLTGDLPAREVVWEDSLLQNNPYTEAFLRQLQHVRPVPSVPEWERIVTKVQAYAEAVIRGRLSIDEALAALDRDVNRILKKRRWMLAH